ncbi:hypothetical protein BpHYR1_008781 [Brachionus plicatilis]|uniref:Uncharacterized protein n=1 Tax=Brachionus plicatilis TaxID=10195 RepID=A0A3M7SC02_BRAPC|nr:hypothetical protein BpHYR1_008781 [Brachionus plicatilis]
MSKEECFIMEFTKKCLGNVMICKDNRCLFSKPAHPAYHWLKTSYAYGLVCSLRYVNLQSDNSKIYNCGIEDLECKTENSIFIWKKTIINKCPFRRLDSMSLNTPFDNIFSNSLGNLIFKIINKSVYCDIEMFETSEGLFFTKNKTNLAKNKNEIGTIHELLLADTDNIELKTYLKLMSLVEDNFDIIKDTDHDIITYSRYGIVYVPVCTVIEKIIIENNADCYKDPKSYGHLTQSSIIRKETKLISCDDRTYWILIEKGTHDTEVYIASHLESVRKGSMDKISEFFDTVTIRKQRLILKIVGRKNIRNNPKINNTEEIAQVHIEENNSESYELAIRDILVLTVCVRKNKEWSMMA